MTEADALLAAAAAAPKDDLPRLVLADWYEEQGEFDRAAFIRAQVQLGQVDSWDRFAVECRHRYPEWLTGQPWQSTLPTLPARGLEWHSTHPFHRGVPGSLVVRDLTAFLDHASKLFDLYPISQLYLPTGTLDQWRTFARGPWLNRVQSIHFYGTATPIEPMAELCGSPGSTGIQEIIFEVASRPGMPEVLRRLLAAPIGPQLKSLGLLAIGPTNGEELVEALAQAGPSIEQLALSVFPATERNLCLLADCTTFANCTRFELRDSPIVAGNLLPLFLVSFIEQRIQSFHLPGCCVDDLWWASSQSGQDVILDVRVNMDPHIFMKNQPWGCLSLTDSLLDDNNLAELPNVWGRLKEIDLRENTFSDEGAAALLQVSPPPDLIALRLDGNAISGTMAQRLQDHFGDTVLFGKSAVAAERKNSYL